MGGKVAIVDASVGETPAERNLTRELGDATTVYKASDGELPPAAVDTARRFDGLVISGSQTSVYDDEAWIHALTAWVRDVHGADIPVLGICWGHQLLAQALGGRVVDMGEYELGYRTVERVGEDPLFEDIPRSFLAFQTHSDRVAELPSGAVELAVNEYGVQAFRLGSSYGVQFHPEYDLDTAEWVVGNKDLSPERHRSVAAALTAENAAAAGDAATAFKNFRALAADNARQPQRRA